MNQRLQCGQGHEWDAADSGQAETAETVARCPACNEIGQAIAPDPKVGTVDFESQKSVFAGIDATLPGRSPPDSVPTVLPQAVTGYTILKELGRGGMGVVYLARQDKLNRLVALKMVLAGRHAGDQDRSRFLAEAAAVAQLQHPNIVQIYEIGEADGRPYFSLEYVNGGSLADRLDGTPIPPRDAASLCAMLARAVQSAHDAGIVHRDLKPANVLLQERRAESEERRAESPNGPPSDSGSSLSALRSLLSAPKITDFGLAKEIGKSSGRTQTGAVLGTPSYMAPEQASGQSRAIGPATDTYALGAILYELITGRPPFLGATPLDTVLQVASEEPVKPTQMQPKCPRDLETICLKCLQKEPRKRYERAGDLADDLQRFLNGEPIKARPVGPVERTWRWTRRNPRVAALLSLLAAVLVVGFALVFALWRQAEARRVQADQQEARAKKNLLKAIEAVDRMLTRVVDERLAYVPQFEDQRRQILEDAVSFYNEFLEQEHSDPALRREIGRAYYRLGKVFVTLGKHGPGRQAFDQARQFQEQLAKEFPDDPAHRNDLAHTLGETAAAFRLTGNTGEAEPLLVRAHALATNLVTSHPDETRFRETLAQLLNQLGYYYFQTRKFDAADTHLNQCLVEYDRLADLKPEDFKIRFERAKARIALATFQQTLGRLGPAEENLVRTIGELEALVRESPDKKKDVEPALANARLSLGAVYAATNRTAQADQFISIGVKSYEGLVQDYPLSPLYRFQLARGHQVIAANVRAANKPEQAEPALQKAVSILTQLDRDNPEAFYQGIILRQCYRELSQIHQSQKKLDVAEQELRTAIAHAEQDARSAVAASPVNQELTEYRLLLSDILAEKGDFASALAEMDKALEVAKSAPRNPAQPDQTRMIEVQKARMLALAGDHAAARELAARLLPQLAKERQMGTYQLACAFALCVKAIRGDPKLTSAEREHLADESARQALDLLARLRTQGFFKVPARLRTLMTDWDLNALRGRDDFKKWLEEFPALPPKLGGKN